MHYSKMSLKKKISSIIAESLASVDIEDIKSLKTTDDLFTSLLERCKGDMESIVDKRESGEITSENISKTVKDCLDGYTVAVWMVGSNGSDDLEGVIEKSVIGRKERIDNFCKMLFSDAIGCVDDKLRLRVWKEVSRDLACDIESVYRRAKCTSI